MKNSEGKYLLEQRPAEGLLASMWQFPMIEKPTNDSSTKTNEVLNTKYNVQLEENVGEQFLKFKHIFSHLTWEMECYLVVAEKADLQDESTRFFSLEEIAKLPMSVPMLKVLNILK